MIAIIFEFIAVAEEGQRTEEESGMVYCHTVENFRPRKPIIDNNAPDYTDPPAGRWTG